MKNRLIFAMQNSYSVFTQIINISPFGVAGGCGNAHEIITVYCKSFAQPNPFFLCP